MEPVPETERMEEFRPAPLPSLRLSGLSGLPGAAVPSPAASPTSRLSDADSPRKPPVVRRSTDPAPASPTSPPPAAWTPSALPYRPRAASPLAASYHQRSKSLVPPPMARTQSLPAVTGSGHLLYNSQRPASPLRQSPGRTRPPKRMVEDVFPTSPVRSSVLDTDGRPPSSGSTASFVTGPPPPALGLASQSTLLRNRRPPSPLRSAAHSAPSLTSSSSSTGPATPTSRPQSPPCRPSHEVLYNGYPMLYSVPSTPTSTRSRSPSMSSLETIPDSPDAEEAALEADRIAQLKAAADADEQGESKARVGLDGAGGRGRMLGFIPRDKRKRWSVCGAERRGDLDLETIWED